MGIFFKLWAICATLTLTSAQLNFNDPRPIPEYIQTQSTYRESLQEPPGSSSDFDNINIQQLPKPDSPRPFNTAEPSTVLKAPPASASYMPNFNTQYPPVPAEELQLPAAIEWNPNNDPNMYYPVNVEQNMPTGLYPKKYNKMAQKVKLYGQKIKAETDSSALKQKQIDKLMLAYAKQENKKLLDSDKLSMVQVNENIQKVNEPVVAESGFVPLSPNFVSDSSSSTSAHFSHNNNNNLAPHDRLHFHVHGHDGPKSYKWGYDTGKGKNRHFRYEERDKHGIVTGQYGYYDTHGKLRVVHYSSHPHEGFQAAEVNPEYH